MKLSDILKESGAVAGLISLSEAPAELKEVISAAFKGDKCPACGEVHGNDRAEQEQEAQYEESDGRSGEYEYQPKEQSAIQFLPHNVMDVIEFLREHLVPFGYSVSAEGEERILLHSFGRLVDRETEELRYGWWAVVSGKRGTSQFGYATCDDAEFRSTFQRRHSIADED